MTAMTLPSALDTARLDLRVRGVGRMGCYLSKGGSGVPMVLIHSINAAPSAFEMRPIFRHYRDRRAVYAPDLPGFGCSDRPDLRYSPQLFADAIAAVLKEVGAPADLVAFSLGCEFAARAALAAPESVRSLVLLSPTGFSSRTMMNGGSDRVHAALSLPGLSQGLYSLLTSRPSIRYFLRQSFVGPVPAEMVDYAYATSHQPGARYAPLHFLSGHLFTPDAAERLYAPLTQPVLVLHDRDANIDFAHLPGVVEGRPNWRVERIAPTLGIPHWEKPAETFAAMDRLYAGLA